MHKVVKPIMSLDQLACKILHKELVLFVGNRRMVRRAELETCLSGITALPGATGEAIIM